MTSRIKTRAPLGPSNNPRTLTGDDLISYLKDAASTPGGHSPAIVFPESEAQVAALIQDADSVLCIGAQSSLTGGATPFGEQLLGSHKFDRLDILSDTRVRVGAGVALLTLNEALTERSLFYPPVPTYDGAFIGGVIACNAAGAQTFKYGVTRDWVEALTVVLSHGEVLDIERGQCLADDEFQIERLDGTVLKVPVPSYQQPQVAKCSAGYWSGQPLDLIDLFIGSEGTLGFVTEATLRVVPYDFQQISGFIAVKDEGEAIKLSAALREQSQKTWQGPRHSGLDINAIEFMDRRSLELLREDGQPGRSGVELQDDSQAALFFQMELPLDMDEEAATEQFAAYFEGEDCDPAFSQLGALLERFDALDNLEIAWPGDSKRAKQLFEMRDRVPTLVNHLVADAQRDVDGRIHKTAADMCVAFEHFAEMMKVYHQGFQEAELDYAIWGHISDGNVHPNVIPKSWQDVVRGKELLLKFGQAIQQLGGSPLAEHGVGRNPIKRALLAQLRGPSGLAQMRATKQALDPHWKWAPGVLFDKA